MPPYWAHGFHLCRWGQGNTERMRTTFFKNAKIGVPIDTQWADIDYMDDQNDFTYDKENFGKLPDFIAELHDMNRHFAINIDPSLGFNQSEPTDAFIDGMENDVFIRDAAGDILVTSVWNNLSVITDFTHPNAGSWWNRSLSRFHEEIEFDALWLDMNEPSANKYYGSIKGCPNNSFDRPQYNPNYPLELEDHSICMSARLNLSSHYNVHNIYSFFEGKASYDALEAIRQKRPFILSRATTTGQGKYTIAHLQGDVHSSWSDMRSSIASILDFNLFGIPFVGSDICGYYDDTTDELCARWSSLGAFYPFSRNHNNNETIDQDPASMGLNVQEAARKSLNLRYTFLPYLYTLLFHHSMTGAPVLRSLKMNFPEDENTNGNDFQFMWSDGLLVNPVLEQGSTLLEAYFPSGVWYDYPTGHRRTDGRPQNITIEIPVTDINIALRGGRIFPLIPSKNKTTHDHRKLPFVILVVLDEDETASGDLYWDDGESLDAISDKTLHSIIKMSAWKGHLLVKSSVRGYEMENLVREVKVWGVRKEVNRVTFRSANQTEELQFAFVDGRLTVRLPAKVPMMSHFTLHWS